MTTTHKHLFKLTATGLLVAIGMLIPVYFPRVVIGPASYTLASHVAIFIAMFISPTVAVAVTAGTTAGFFFTGLDIIIVLRAASHIIWALPGAIYLSKIDKFNAGWLKMRTLSLGVGIFHGLGEIAAVAIFFAGMGQDMDITWLLGFIGLGTLIHSLVDFEIANAIRLILQKQKGYRDLAG